jgi:hypothetical protein
MKPGNRHRKMRARDRAPTPREVYDSAVDKIIDRTFKRPLPPALYHYTNEAGLRGILESRVIHATHFSDLKADSLELRHVDPLVVRVAQDLWTKATPRWCNILGEFLEEYPRLKIAEVPGPPPHIACFCLEADRPLLWRDFGDAGTGYCVGFKMLKEEHEVKIGDAQNFPVIYSPEEQEALIRNAFRSVIEAQRKFSSLSARDTRSIALNGMYRIAAFTNIGSKAKSFEHERESRLVVSQLIPPSPALRTLEHPRRILWPLRRAGAMPFLDSIHVGFRHDAQEVQRVTAFLRGLGYGEGENPPLPPVTLSTAGGNGVRPEEV